MSRPFSAALLRGSPSFRRLTGVSVATFDRMVASLTAPWDKQQARKLKSGRPSDLGGLDDHLLVLLIYYRCYVTQEFLGFFYHVNKSAICRAIQRVEVVKDGGAATYGSDAVAGVVTAPQLEMALEVVVALRGGVVRPDGHAHDAVLALGATDGRRETARDAVARDDDRGAVGDRLTRGAA